MKRGGATPHVFDVWLLASFPDGQSPPQGFLDWLVLVRVDGWYQDQYVDAD